MDVPGNPPQSVPIRAPAWLRHAARRALLGVAVAGLAASVQAQSVAPNRYGTPAIPPASSTYERQRQVTEDTQRRQDSASRQAEQDRIGIAIDANRRKVEVDRARTERRRAAALSPVESERMRLEYEQRRQAYEREREELERQRAASEARPAPPPEP